MVHQYCAGHWAHGSGSCTVSHLIASWALPLENRQLSEAGTTSHKQVDLAKLPHPNPIVANLFQGRGGQRQRRRVGTSAVKDGPRCPITREKTEHAADACICHLRLQRCSCTAVTPASRPTIQMVD